jgi:hypothetical protein
MPVNAIAMPFSFCGGDRFVVFDRSAETGDWCQACDFCDSLSLTAGVLSNDLGASALENPKPERGLGPRFSFTQ